MEVGGSSGTTANKPGHLRLTKQENAYFEQLFAVYAEEDRAKKDKVRARIENILFYIYSIHVDDC